MTGQIRRLEGHTRIGRVLHEDKDFITLEIAKDLQRELQLQDGDRFFSIVFVKARHGRVESWLPWEEDA